jgi:predicted amidophosphoribosyltransferase
VCHAVLAQAAAGPKPDTRGVVGGAACPMCGTACATESGFCRQCGASLSLVPRPVAAPRRFCSQCGAPVRADARFCCACGHRFDG